MERTPISLLRKGLKPLNKPVIDGYSAAEILRSGGICLLFDRTNNISNEVILTPQTKTHKFFEILRSGGLSLLHTPSINIQSKTLIKEQESGHEPSDKLTG